MTRTADVLIVGAGIVGLALARELVGRDPALRITVVDKEPEVGRHSSGRNSGVLHSGIYYPEGSLKAKLCADGARELAEYCQENGLSLLRCGKVILPLREEDDPRLDLLAARARSNGARVALLDERELAELEPEARTATGRALHSPGTSVIDSLEVLRHIAAEVQGKGVMLLLGHTVEPVSAADGQVKVGGEAYSYGLLVNTAGLHADRLAQAFGVGRQYTILPFKGIYYRLAEASNIRVNGLIYPVPDLGVPFLGVHFTLKVDGQVYLGPTAIPAFGRENYFGIAGAELGDIANITRHLIGQYLADAQGFRTMVHQESTRMLKSRFAAAARALVPKVHSAHLLGSSKRGIRAQLLNVREKKMEMDFVVEKGDRSVHILNAVSPAFTSSFSFSRYIADHYLNL